MQTEQIVFKRIERKCPHNEHLRALGLVVGLIYDFEVFIDEVKCATFTRKSFRRGFDLFDLDGRIVKAPWIGADGVRRIGDPKYNWRNVDADTKSNFIAVIQSELDYIPTPEQIEQRRADEEKAERAKVAAEREAERIQLIKDAGLELLDALEAARINYIERNGVAVPEDVNAHPLLVKMDSAIAKAKGAQA